MGSGAGPAAISVLVVGAGPAGLATSRELARAGVDHLVAERGDRIAHTWENLYDGLVLHTGKHLSSLPGMPFPSSTPLFPTRRHFVEYLGRYAEKFRLPVATRTEITAIERQQERWAARTAGGETLRARALVLATGIVSNPHLPEIAGAHEFTGRMFHSVEYRRPEPFRGQRVLVVGAGNSAGEISVELASAGALVTIAVRSGARVVPLQLLGVPIQYLGVALGRLPRPAQRALADIISRVSGFFRGPAALPPAPVDDCPDVPLIGFHLTDAIRAGTVRLQPGVAGFSTDRARFVNGTSEAFDTVILATGYRAAVRPLGGLIGLDDCGFARRRDRVVSTDQPDLYFVGHNYDVRGGLRNIAMDARRVARHVSRAARA